MIKYDSDSIRERAIQKLNQDPDWSAVVNSSVIDALIRSNAEINAETARYAEYLFKESKWDTAQNRSSILSMASIFGYQPSRKKSAVGNIEVSVDSRIHNVGSTLNRSALTNNNFNFNSYNSDIYITSRSIVTDDHGISYVPQGTVKLSSNEGHVSVPLVQGKIKRVSIDIDTIRKTCTTSKLDPYLYIPVSILNCEDASNAVTKAFLRVFVVRKEGNSFREYEYRIVNSLLTSSSEDTDVEVYNDIYNSNLFYLKFNNDSSRGQCLDITSSSSILGISIQYLESIGTSGNTTNIYKKFNITNAIVSNGAGGFRNINLYGISTSAFTGGTEEESISEIKTNAPRYYIKNFTSGTKESYEKTISSMEFSISIPNSNKSYSLRPYEVKVYAGDYVDNESSNIVKCTCVTFLASNLEDIVNLSSSESSEAYTAINDALSYNLSYLKSPQDILRFVPPNYVSLALGLDCTVSFSESEDITELESNIRNYVNYYYGPNSSQLKFDRNYYSTEVTSGLMNYFNEIKNIEITTEAITKIDLDTATRYNPKKTSSDVINSNPNIVHTFRLNYSFDSIFKGSSDKEGFLDIRSQSSYIMRIDFMYKKPRALVSIPNIHTSIFVENSVSNSDSTDEKDNSFYLKNCSNGKENVWPNDFSNMPDYSSLSSTYVNVVNSSKQFYYNNVKNVYNDRQYSSLKRDIESTSNKSSVTQISTHDVSIGCIDDYLIYFSGNYDTVSSNKIGEGWIELTFDPIYENLEYYAQYDSDLRELLNECPLANLKCGQSGIGDTFKKFVNILKEYIEIYVCMRPVDNSKILINSKNSSQNTVLYIDSSDSDSSTNGSNLTNLTSDKMYRMISIRLENKDN